MSFLSPIHIVFFAAVALLALGPKRFPEFTRTLGNSLREFRQVLSEVPRREDLAKAVTADAATSAPLEAPSAATPPSPPPPATAPAPEPASAPVGARDEATQPRP